LNPHLKESGVSKGGPLRFERYPADARLAIRPGKSW
jgi:hypothetical protein